MGFAVTKLPEQTRIFEPCMGEFGRPMESSASIWARNEPANQHQTYAQAIEQGDVVNDVGEVFVLRNRAPQHQHKGLASMCVDVGCRISEPAYMSPPGCRHGYFQAID
jgi:hypothetical protein